ncbi:MAG: hypothetical protein LQ348_007350 [Seirophora lacunosa]|nr:MAG: hypothetical protein LQ348_007350 [Seirophora lacunosa]
MRSAYANATNRSHNNPSAVVDVPGCSSISPLRGLLVVEGKKVMVRCILPLLSIWQLTNAVNVVITTGMRSSVPLQICTNLLPGQCCQALPVPFTNYNNPFDPGAVNFRNLMPSDIAAVWARRGNIRACSGVPIETRAGPGNWHHEATGDERAYGASYITLPRSLPPGETEANWLSAEGVLGLVWGGGRWFAKGAESLGRGLRRRGVVSAEKGTVYSREPQRWRWPDVVVVNGTRYIDAGTADFLYQSAEGQVVNMTG